MGKTEEGNHALFSTSTKVKGVSAHVLYVLTWWRFEVLLYIFFLHFWISFSENIISIKISKVKCFMYMVSYSIYSEMCELFSTAEWRVIDILRRQLSEMFLPLLLMWRKNLLQTISYHSEQVPLRKVLGVQECKRQKIYQVCPLSPS